MKQKKWVSIILAIMLLPCMPITTYANSSWHWLTKTNPFDVLPYAVILTLLIEYVTIKRANSITAICAGQRSMMRCSTVGRRC